MRLDPGQDSELLEALGKQWVSRAAAALVQCLGVQDSGGEVVVGARGLKQHLAVGPAGLLAIGNTILGESVACMCVKIYYAFTMAGILG